MGWREIDRILRRHDFV